jgi:hypothetical protein
MLKIRNLNYKTFHGLEERILIKKPIKGKKYLIVLTEKDIKETKVRMKYKDYG